MNKQTLILHLTLAVILVTLIYPYQVHGFKKIFYKKLIKAGILGKLLLGGKKVIIAFPMPIPIRHEMSSPWSGGSVGFAGNGGGNWPSMWSGGWESPSSPWSF